MDLLLDIGNARIKWAFRNEDGFQAGEPLVRKGVAFKDIAQAAWQDCETPARVIVSNVAGEAYEKSVRAWLKRRWKITPEFLRAQGFACGIRNAYKKPERLGADRWAALIAAHADFAGASIIIDCGTAITIDALAADGTHLGGLIVPGLDLMASALAGNAAGVQLDDPGCRDIALLGSSTESGVSGGALYAAVALADRIYQDLQNELGAATRLLITGGDARRLLPLLSHRPEYDANLVLKGLAVFARETAPCVT